MLNKCGKVFFALLVAVPMIRSGNLNFLPKMDNVEELLEEHPQCRTDLKSWEEAVARGEMWALQMLDASTKLPPGLFTGNFIDYGNYDECVNAVPKGTNTHLVPQHCMVSFKFPLNLPEGNSSLGIPYEYHWSYCLPDSCPPKALEAVVSRVIGTNATVLPSDCHTAKYPWLSPADIFGIVVWVGFAVLVVISTLYDVTVTVLNIKKNPWLISFSFYTNVGRLLSPQVSPGTLKPLNGIRFLSMAWIILGHRYYFTTLAGVMNLSEVPKEFEKVYFQIFVGGVLAVDTFFLLSGLLNTYILLNLLDVRKKFPFGSFYIHRYLRTTPALAAVILMHSTWFTLIGFGPWWDRITAYSKQLCLENWWSTLLYINNYYNPVNQCAGQSWYLAVDMQLYWLSPLVIVPIWKWPKIRKYYLGLLLSASTASLFLVAYIHKFRMAFSVSFDAEESKRVIELLYVPTHTRATPYIIGIMLGIYLDNVRNQSQKPKWSKIMVVLGWLISAATCLSVLFGNYPFFRSAENHPYNRLESSLYISLHRIGWGAGVSWVIIACLFGYGGAVNSFLSWNAFVPLSRLTYCLFLTHIPVQYYQIGMSRTSSYYQIFDMIHRFFGDLMFSIFGALMLSLLFESPFTVLERLVLRKERKTKSDLQSYTNKAFQET